MAMPPVMAGAENAMLTLSLPICVATTLVGTPGTANATTIRREIPVDREALTVVALTTKPKVPPTVGVPVMLLPEILKPNGNVLLA